eukprot:TRINITY_DN16138_c0_g1_i10.p1 TRINITY_DN16138_c0_g1~~TRINITY_DN16138_c0_g1_i10.p1  ORF type:complete len:805 (-),score=200.29 TRINITY_DN16138_c0_g1_i10:430-2844(-)
MCIRDSINAEYGERTTSMQRVLLIALTALVPACLATPPKFQWYQDTETLYLDIDVTPCEAAPGAFKFSQTAFQWFCGDTLRLEFEFREEVRPDGSNCERTTSSRGSSKLQSCKFQKRLPHHFDRLTTPGSAGPLKRYMRTDWRRTSSAPPEKPHNEPYTEEEELVPTVTEEELHSMTPLGSKAGNKMVVADVMYPWCENHQTLAAVVVEAAQKLRRNSKISFVYVNAVEQPGLANSLNVTCGQASKLHLYRQGEPRFGLDTSDDLATPADLAKTLKAFLAPAAKLVNSDKEYKKATIDSVSPVIVGFLGGDEQRAEWVQFRGIARRLMRLQKAPVQSFLVANKSVRPDVAGGNPTPFLVAYQNGRKVATTASLPWKPAALFQWALVHTTPPILDFDYGVKDMVATIGLPVAQVWPSQDGQQHQRLSALATKYRGTLVFLRMGRRDTYLMEEFGFGGKDISHSSALGLAKTFGDFEDKERFGFSGDDLNDPATEKFIDDFLAGVLSPSMKSQIPPTAPVVAGELNEVVASNLMEVASAKPTVVALYKSYMEEWEQAEKALKSAAKLLKNVDTVQFAKLDTSTNGVDPSVFQRVDGHHGAVELFIMTAGSASRVWKSQSFSSGDTTRLRRDVVLGYLKKHSPEVADRWETVQAAIDQEDLEAQALEEARIKAEAERYAKARRVEVDAGVTKFVFEEGQDAGDNRPVEGDEVTAHYTGTLENGDKFDSSVDRGEPFKFRLGKGQVIKCWDKGFATMKVGEKADLKCSSDNAYGERGSPPKIPAGATLIFKVELISFKSTMANLHVDL